MRTKGTKVLIVDDEDLIRSVLRSELEDHEVHVVEAANGRAAMRMLVNHADIDIVLTDIIMPDTEGIELITHVRKNYPHIRVIAMSGGGRGLATEYLGAARLLGATRILEKPFAPAELVSALESL